MAKPITTREFLKGLAEERRKLRQDIAAQALDLDPAGTPDRRRRVLSGDFKFFAYQYFPHHIRGESSLFQAQFCDRFPQLLFSPQGCREWWIAPRGECKSSLLTKVGPVYIAVIALLQKEEIRKEIGWTGNVPPNLDYVIFLGAETRLPTKLLEVVRTELTVNASLALDFPDVCGRSSSWKVGEFVTRTGVKMEPFGAEMAIRGTFHGASRPKVALGDDLITDAEAKSPTERQNRWDWLEKSIDYLGPPDGTLKYLGVGTVLNADDPVSRAKRTPGHIVHHFRAVETMPTRMDLWEQCEEIIRNKDKIAEEEAAKKNQVLAKEERPSFRFWKKNQKAMEQGAVTSWPAVRSLYDLMWARAKSRRAFNTEYQGDGKSDEDKVFTAWTFWVQRLHHWIWFGACDPSIGQGMKSDPSAILAGGWDPEKLVLHVAYAKSKRRTRSKLSAELIAVQQEFRCRAFAFENNNGYEHSRQTFIEDAQRKGVNLPLVGITATVGSEVLIDDLEPIICDQYDPKIKVLSSLSQLTDQLSTFPDPPQGHHYDLLIGLYLLYQIALKRGRGGAAVASRARAAINVLMQGYQ